MVWVAGVFLMWSILCVSPDVFMALFQLPIELLFPIPSCSAGHQSDLYSCELTYACHSTKMESSAVFCVHFMQPDVLVGHPFCRTNQHFIAFYS